MRDYNIDEAREIMKNHHHNDLVITSHFEERCLYRKLDINYIVNAITAYTKDKGRREREQ